jgi:hypothetical protein
VVWRAVVLSSPLEAPTPAVEVERVLTKAGLCVRSQDAEYSVPCVPEGVIVQKLIWTLANEKVSDSPG